MNTAYNSNRCDANSNESCARVCALVVHERILCHMGSRLSIYLSFFFGVRLFDSICCSRVNDWRPGECSMYEINERHISKQPKNIVRHAHATVYFLFASNAWEKIFFLLHFVICLSFLMHYTFTTIINNLLFSLQNKFPFFFFFVGIYVNGSISTLMLVTNITLHLQSALLSLFDSCVIDFCIS